MSGKQARAARAEAGRRFSEREVITVCAAQHELATREAIGLVRAYLEAAVTAAAKTDTPEIREQRLAEWQTLELVLAEMEEQLVANFPLAVDAARSGRPAPQITIRPLAELRREAAQAEAAKPRDAAAPGRRDLGALRQALAALFGRTGRR